MLSLIMLAVINAEWCMEVYYPELVMLNVIMLSVLVTLLP
jgi:hypothetical protein